MKNKTNYTDAKKGEIATSLLVPIGISFIAIILLLIFSDLYSQIGIIGVSFGLLWHIILLIFSFKAIKSNSHGLAINLLWIVIASMILIIIVEIYKTIVFSFNPNIIGELVGIGLIIKKAYDGIEEIKYCSIMEKHSKNKNE